MNFNNHRGDNKYNIFANMEVYDRKIYLENQPDFYAVWVTNTAFLQLIDYYKSNNEASFY